jgi:hypothetical protein
MHPIQDLFLESFSYELQLDMHSYLHKNFILAKSGCYIDGADHGIDDDFDYEELLHHVKPQVLNSMGTDRGLDNIEILEKSSREPLYDESNGCSKEFT